MKIVLKILGIIALIVWEVAFIVNFTTYDTAGQVMCVVLMVIPFPIMFLVAKVKKRKNNRLVNRTVTVKKDRPELQLRANLHKKGKFFSAASKSDQSQHRNRIDIRRKKYRAIEQEYKRVTSQVQDSVVPHEDIPFSEEEEIFFKSLILEMKVNGLWEKEGLKLTRLSDMTFNVDCFSCYIGKIRLRKSRYMQVLRGASQIKEFNDVSLEECLEQIPAWIRYIKYCRRN